MRQGRYNDAIKDYLYLSKIESPQRKAEPLTKAGECYIALKRPKEALTYFDQAIQVSAGCIDAHRGKIAALEALKDTKAAEQERKSLQQMVEEFGSEK